MVACGFQNNKSNENAIVLTDYDPENEPALGAVIGCGMLQVSALAPDEAEGLEPADA